MDIRELTFFSECCECTCTCIWLCNNKTNSFTHILQAKFDHDMPCETVSKINLVDLAGRYIFIIIIVFSFFHHTVLGNLFNFVNYQL